jgi:excisionase family DNA binding protein
MVLTKKEACKLLGISPRTLERRMASGRYTFTRTGEGQFAELSLTHTGIGLPEPEPVAVVEPVPAESTPTYDVPIRPEYNDEPADTRTFAERYLANEVPDSAGNYFNGTNARWPTKGIQSLLGPQEPKPKEKFSCDAHMGAYQTDRRPMIGTDGEPVYDAGSDNHPLNKGRTNVGEKQKSHHPNQTRQEFLNAIWSDIRRGFSR